MGKGNGQINGWRKIPLHYYGAIIRLHIRYYLLLLDGRMFDLQRNGIYAILSEGNNNNNCSIIWNKRHERHNFELFLLEVLLIGAGSVLGSRTKK